MNSCWSVRLRGPEVINKLLLCTNHLARFLIPDISIWVFPAHVHDIHLTTRKNLSNFLYCITPRIVRIHRNDALLKLIKERILFLDLTMSTRLPNSWTDHCNRIILLILLCIRKHLESRKGVVLSAHNQNRITHRLKAELAKHFTIFPRLTKRLREILRVNSCFISRQFIVLSTRVVSF